ncbi:MAG: type restriction enzyme protein [Acidobacteriota bacterium]|jgi:type I restriction enzyme M protein|nr:type restriction enzyme protein [Acidobacteriota bacterium]
MPFPEYNEAFKNPASVPVTYREHASTQKLFRPNGKYIRALEDPVTLWAIDVLVNQYGVPLEALALEFITDFSEGAHERGRRYLGRADVVIYDDRYVDAGGGLDTAFIMLEAMEPGKQVDGSDTEGWKDHYTRLNSYMSASASARYAILTSGKHTRIYRRDLEYPRALQEIPDLPRYESAREAAKHSPYKVILNPSEPDGITTHLKPLTRDKFREVLGDTRSGCHSILRDNEGLQPQEAVDAMVKFLFAKWYDEQATVDLAKQAQKDRAYVFSVSTETDPERLVIQVRDTFEKAKQWEKETLSRKFGDQVGVRLAFSEADVLMFRPHTTVEIAKRLQPWSLRRSTADVKGGVFEDFLSKTFRDDLGQYFTPTPVINLMVGLLQPTVDDYVGDPACGSARMLTHVLDYVRKQEYAKAIAANGGKFDGINPEEPTEAFIKFRDNQLFGAETSRNVMHVARVNTLMNGAHYADLRGIDSLSQLSSITGGIMKGLPEFPGFYLGGLTMDITNPPFGSVLTNNRVIEDFSSRDGVTRRNGKNIKTIPQEVAFLNRCLEYLTPGGRLVSVVPDGVLANLSLQYVRDWLLRWGRLKAVVSLPQETFAPYGAGVKTSIIVLEKRALPLPSADSHTRPDKKSGRRMKKGAQDQGSLLEVEPPAEPVAIATETSAEPSLVDEDYDVYMARIDDIGYDATGRLTVPEERAGFPPEVEETIADFNKMVGWQRAD